MKIIVGADMEHSTTVCGSANIETNDLKDS